LRTRVDPEAAERLEETREQERSALEKMEILEMNKTRLLEAISMLDGQKVRCIVFSLKYITYFCVVAIFNVINTFFLISG
jgi:hypothetical protein